MKARGHSETTTTSRQSCVTGDSWNNGDDAKEIAVDLLRRQQSWTHEPLMTKSDGPVFRSGRDVSPAPPLSPSSVILHTSNVPECKIMAPGRLYGRNEKKRLLKSHCHRLLTNNRNKSTELILVTAASGFGKTELVTSLEEEKFEDLNVKLVKGKFQTRQMAPYAAYAEAMSELLHHISSCYGAEKMDAIRKRLKDDLGDEATLLSASIPALDNFLGEIEVGQSSTSNLRNALVLGPETLVRFRTVFCKLVTSICSCTDSVILFLDDLQWAEKESLELLLSLLVETTVEGLVIIGACRGNEVSTEDDLSVTLRDLEDNKGICVNEINLFGLDEEDVVEMISDLFNIPRPGCLDLGKYLYKICDGQPLHTLQLVRSLHANGVITRSDGRLNFDKERAENLSEDIGKDALELVSDLVRHLPDELQKWLSVAAFLGAEIDEDSIGLASERTFDQCVSDALQAGLITQSRDQGGTPRFRFAHDIIQQACYERISQDKRDQMHYDIAMHMWKKSNESNSIQDHSIAIATHLRYGIYMLKSEEEQVQAAELFTLAAKQANLASAFQSSTSFLRLARQLLPVRTRWRDYYTLSLEIFASSAEVELVVGNFDECDKLCEHIIARGHSVNDMIPAYSTMMYSLGCRSRLQEAIEVGLKVMENLGETIPRKPGLVKLLLALRRTENRLRNLSAGDILSLPRLRDPTKIAAMQILNVLFTYCYTQTHSLQVMVTAKMIEITLDHGLSACSAVGFAFHSVIVCTNFERLSEACRYARISLDLLDAFGLNEYTARVYTYVYGITMSAIRPMIECLPQLEHAYQCGIVTGDTEFSMFALHLYTSNKFYNGTQLRLVFDEAEEAKKSMLMAGQESAAQLQEAVVLALAGILDLTVPDVFICGHKMTRQAMIDLAKKEGNTTLLVVVYGNWAVEHFWNGDYENAAKYFKMTRAVGLQNVTFHFRCCLVFMEGMTNFILVTESQSRRYTLHWRRMRRGRRSLLFLQKHCTVSSANFLLQVQLLEALLAHIEGDSRLSMSKYRLAAERARETGMLAEEALTNELLGRAISRRNPTSYSSVEARCLLNRARDLFSEWGAVHKVKTLDTLLEN